MTQYVLMLNTLQSMRTENEVYIKYIFIYIIYNIYLLKQTKLYSSSLESHWNSGKHVQH